MYLTEQPSYVHPNGRFEDFCRTTAIARVSVSLFGGRNSLFCVSPEGAAQIFTLNEWR